MSFSALPGRLLRASRCLPKTRKPALPSSFAAAHRAAFRNFSATAYPRTSAIPKIEGTLGGLADSIAARPKAAAAAAKKAWPEVSDKKVGYWLIGSATLVFGIVVLGGLTRLTESG